MSGYIQLSAIALVTAVLVLTVRKHSDAIASVLAIAGCCVCGILLCNIAEPVFSFVRQTAQIAGIDEQLLSPLLKTVGIGLLTQFSADVCTDAGQTALAKFSQTGGTVLCVCVSIPLMRAVLSVVQTMTGG